MDVIDCGFVPCAHRCECICHTMKGVMHIMPCCDGACPECRKPIRYGRKIDHLVKCHHKTREESESAIRLYFGIGPSDEDKAASSK